MTAMPLPTSNKASFVAGWPQFLHALRLERLLQALIAEKILFIVIK